jgi:hypothetical protein
VVLALEVVEAIEAPEAAPEVLAADQEAHHAHQEEVTEDIKSQKSISTH